ncbi:MAG TPA: EAL domain-containing protein, partial [Pseudomonadales bacterium]
GMAPLPVSINISPRQFNQPDLASNIGAALRRHGLDPALLEIEITENCLARDRKKFLHTLAEMRALGLRLSIDDFGSGYSNMDYLKSMHFSSLKIDRAFIASIEEGGKPRALYRALISLAHNLSLVVVAEGVETQRQVDFLCDIGCDLIQGYHFSMPLRAVEFAALRTGQTL